MGKLLLFVFLTLGVMFCHPQPAPTAPPNPSPPPLPPIYPPPPPLFILLRRRLFILLHRRLRKSPASSLRRLRKSPALLRHPDDGAVPAAAGAGVEGLPINTLKLGACVDLLGGLIHIGIGPSAADTCCPLLRGLADLDAALCLCTAIRAKVLNINLLLPIALELLVNNCGKHVPSDFQCPH
ncbi:unnamed protein product [Spirodela intermedia]|uniref:Bifunctional inhibitor/plant lipid transfer protein/seed storage helical domain-containing protein n=1 Tax=Spirodela intermedia TaxID=51605 RepID=A0A7I8JEQ8_SPIIN|nr:unnamed protein product [Spirodela intermedia]CAA6668640.1 unnamed protein product [Spirodela intermedia]